MAPSFIAVDREQGWLMPPSVRDWLPDGHLALFVLDVVERLDVSGIVKRFRADGSGRPAHDPRMMVALLLYAYCVGELSSRRIERRCVEDVAFRVIAANQVPDHTTIARFRQRHAAALAGLFEQVLVMCGRAGLVKVGAIAIDGSKLAADASLDANRSYGAIRREVERMLAEAAAVDAAEDEQFGSARGDELPAELADAGSRRARLEQIQRELEAEQAAREAAWQETERRRQEHQQKTGKRPTGRPPQPPPPDALERQVRNTTDPDSRMMRMRGMAMQGYNAQLAVNAAQVVLACDVSTQGNDQALLAPMLEETKRTLARAGIEGRLETVLADSGYFNNQAIAAAQAEGIRVLVPPRGNPARPGTRQRSGPIAQEMDHELATPEGRRLYGRRQVMVEPVFARTKHHRKITRFFRRGQVACQAEWRLINTAHNLLRLHSTVLQGG